MSEIPKSNAELDLLRRTYRQEVMRPGSLDCPSEEAVVALVLGEIEHASRREVADHVAGCQHCAESFRVLSQLHEHAAGNGNARRTRTWVGLAAAAMLLMGIGTYAILQARFTPPTDVLRAPGATTVTPADGALLDAPPPSLSWSAEPGAVGYRVRVYASDGALVWESVETEPPRVAVPPDAGVSAGRAYFWTVAVEGSVRTRELGPFTFEVR